MLRQLQSSFTYLYNTFLAKPSTGKPVCSVSMSHRARTSYKSNITASLMLPEIYCEVSEKKPVIPKNNTDLLSWFAPWLPQNLFTKTEAAPVVEKQAPQCFPLRQNIKDLEQQRRQTENEILQDTILEKEVDLNAGRIRQHAALRVDLYFYLLVAVYKTYHTVNKDKTVKQHGKGSKDINTQACHSSLFPNVVLTTPTASSWGMFNSIMKRNLKGTQFEETLNLTVELPNIVNAFDGHIEGRYQPTKYIQQLLALLQQTSMGIITPKDAMLGFFKIMNIFFGQMEQRLAAEDNAPNQAMKKVCLYEKEGTFSVANPNFSLNEDYLYLMLRLSKNEISVAKCSNKILDRFYLRIQEEIYQSKSVLNSEPSSAPKKNPG